MNNLIKVFLMLLLVFSGDISSLASPKSISFHLVRVAEEEPYVPDLSSGRHRSNRRPLSGEITSSGVSIPGVEISDIISFEIYDPSGICLGIYSDEMDFVNALFSLNGEYEIVFVTENTTFAGIIEI